MARKPSLFDGRSSLAGTEIGSALMERTSGKESAPGPGRSRKESQPPPPRARESTTFRKSRAIERVDQEPGSGGDRPWCSSQPLGEHLNQPPLSREYSPQLTGL